MRSKSTSKPNNNFYKYLRGSFAGKDFYQTYEEVLEVDDHSKSEKTLKTNPYLQTNIK